MDTEDMYTDDIDREDIDIASPRMPPCHKLELNTHTPNRDQVTDMAIEMVTHYNVKRLDPCLAPESCTKQSHLKSECCCDH